MMSLLNSTSFDFRSAIRASRSSTSKAIVPASAGARLFLGEIGEGKAAAAGQIVFDPPTIAAISVAADLQAELVLIEVPRARNVGDRVHGERDFLEHGAFLLWLAFRKLGRLQVCVDRLPLLLPRRGAGVRVIGSW